MVEHLEKNVTLEMDCCSMHIGSMSGYGLRGIGMWEVLFWTHRGRSVNILGSTLNYLLKYKLGCFLIHGTPLVTMALYPLLFLWIFVQ